MTYKVRTLRLRSERIGRGFSSHGVFTDPKMAAAMFRRLLPTNTKEHFMSILLDVKHMAIGFEIVSVGSLAASIVHPREVFRLAIEQGASALIVGHSHPSGSSEPSAEDEKTTKKLLAAGQTIGIPVLDHVIISSIGGYYSFREKKKYLWQKKSDGSTDTPGKTA